MSLVISCTRRLLVASVSVLLLAACVPAAKDDREPRGAAGLKVEPSGASRGEPFVTADGWTLRFEQLALVGLVSASSSRSGSGGASATLLVWNGAQPAEQYAPALPVGPGQVELELTSVYFNIDGSHSDLEDKLETLGPALAKRFKRDADTDHPDDAFARDDGIVSGPSVVFVLRAEKGADVKTLDLGLASPFAGFEGDEERSTQVVVRANDVTFGQVELAAERFFSKNGKTGEGILFEKIADADRLGDGDGRITPDELRALHVEAIFDSDFSIYGPTIGDSSCKPFGEGEIDSESGTHVCLSLLDVLSRRTGALIVNR